MEAKKIKVTDHTILVFCCAECNGTFKFEAWEDPTSSKGCCKSCGSSHWYINDLSGRRID